MKRHPSRTSNKTHIHAIYLVVTDMAVRTESCRGNVSGQDFLFSSVLFNKSNGRLKYMASSGWRISELWCRKDVDETCCRLFEAVSWCLLEG